MSDAPANEFEGFTFDRNIAPREVTGGMGLLGAAEEIVRAAVAGLEDAANMVKDKTVERTPLLTPDNYKRAGRWGGDQGGAPDELRKSARVDMEGHTAAISFNTIYASLQHERMDWHHTDGEAKYLERTMNETRSEQVRIIADRIREVTGG
ncbi:MAG TPA: hypothetical protein VFH56_04345 [Acidimicrobiales bacterium]|nr:hypothetical protein [Acidimicrobiales bacterium]